MRRLTFRQRQFLTLLALVIVPLTITIGIALPSSRDSIFRRTTRQLEAVAELKTVQVQQWLDEGREVTHLMVNLREMREALPTLLSTSSAEDRALARARLDAELEILIDIFPKVRSVSLLHPTSGRVLISTDPTQEGRERGNEAYFRNGQQQLYVSSAAYSVGRESPVLYVSAPVRDKDPEAGEDVELLGVVVTEMNLSDLQATLGSRAGLGQTGRAYLVDAYGFYVTLPPEVKSGPMRTTAKSEGVHRVLARQNGSDTYVDSRGIPVLGIFHWLPEGRLGLLVEIEEAELTRQVTRTWMLVILITLSVLVLALITARYLANWLVAPLEQIAGTARALSAGDLGHRAPPGGPDEIGQLAATFNEMADRLQLYYGKLEQLVEQRTAELQTANEQLQREISERVRGEEQIRQQKDLLENTIESLSHPFYVINADDYTLEMANSATTDFGNVSETTTCYALTHGSSSPCDNVEHPCPLALVKTTKKPVTVEHLHRDMAGSTRYMEIHGYPIFDNAGNVVRMIEYSFDITARKQTEEALRQATEAAEEARRVAEAANRAKSVFLANMSHELRTPLNAILGYAQLMGHQQHLGWEAQENVAIIRRSGEHLLALINDVLELSKIEAGRVEMQEENFDLHLMLVGLEEMFYLRALDKGLKLSFDLAPDVPQYVRTDEGKLRQVLINLLSNAVKFTQEGTITVRARCPDHLAAHKLCFEVEDTGVGIAPEELETVFEAFVQTRGGKQAQEGTGLGLPISRRFVQLMGGGLTIRSKLGRGAIFKFDIPIDVVDTGDIIPKKTSRRVIALEPDQPCYRILIVDDNTDSRQLLIKLLGPLGFELREASNGQEAIEVWESWPPHLIWMDMQMPVMNGYEAAKRIKATAKGQDTVIIAVTAVAFEEERAMILSAGCDDFVRKPFQENEIFAAMHNHIGVRFVYEESSQIGSEQGQQTDRKIDLSVLPSELLLQFEEATAQADMLLVDRLIAKIGNQHPHIAEVLAKLAYDFEYDKILAMIKEHKVE